jgi:hypothetical protein
MREALLRLATGHVRRVAGPQKSLTSLLRRRPDLAGNPTRISDLLIEHRNSTPLVGMLLGETLLFLGSSVEPRRAQISDYSGAIPWAIGGIFLAAAF